MKASGAALFPFQAACPANALFYWHSKFPLPFLQDFKRRILPFLRNFEWRILPFLRNFKRRILPFLRNFKWRILPFLRNFTLPQRRAIDAGRKFFRRPAPAF